jgi:acyl-CoA thioester hydrolase
MMPVLEYKTKYIKPARYDDLLTIKIIIKDKPGVRIRFEYEVYNEAQVLLNVSETTLVFVNKETAKPSMPGGHFQQLMHQFFE